MVKRVRKRAAKRVQRQRRIGLFVPRKKHLIKGVSTSSILHRLRQENPTLSAHQARHMVNVALKKGLEGGFFVKRNRKWFAGNPQCSPYQDDACSHSGAADESTPIRGKIMMVSLLREYGTHLRRSHANLMSNLSSHLNDVDDFIERKKHRDQTKDWQVLHELEETMVKTIILKYHHQRQDARATGLRHLAHYLHEVHPTLLA